MLVIDRQTICNSYFSCFGYRMPNKATLGWKDLLSLVIMGGKNGMVVGVWGSWSHCVPGQETEMKATD